MKKLFLFAAAATMLAACTTDTTEDVAQIVVPDCLQVSIADEESRMQLSNEKTVWTAGDKVSVFYKSDANQCWKFNGKTGDRSGTLSCVSQGTATAKMEKVVIVYPYSESYMITPSSGNIEAKLPAVQKYLHGSYGLESSPMISSGYYTQFALKNVCGWLKLQLSGTGTITKITLKGNNDEQLAGDMYIDADDATVTLASASVDNDDNQETGGTLVFEDSIVKEVELDCDGGVDLSGADVTPFYIALPPTVFEKGFTATLHFDNGMQKEISTSKKVEITRNHIVPMEELAIDMSAYIVIKYVTSNKRIIDNSAKNSSWWASVVSNTYDTENNVGTLVIPKGSSIGNNAFQNVTGLLSIEIPDNMKGSIDYSAFDGCTALKSITMSKNTSKIYNYAFRNCTSLTKVYITDITKWCEIYFYDAYYEELYTNPLIYAHNLYLNGELVTDLAIPDGVTSIGRSAFYGCSSLTSVTIPDSVTSIDEFVFRGCSSLTSITIPDSVTSIGYDAFRGCSNLTNVYITNIDKWCTIHLGSLNGMSSHPLDNNVQHNLYLNGELVTDLVIPDGVSSIGNYAFRGCSNLTSITIPDSVTSIGNYAFSSCSSLTSVTIPGSVTSMDYGVFSDCRGLTSINILDGVTSIGYGAFRGCSNLTSITIPDSVTSIGDYAFEGCSSLTSITIPDSVTSIGNSAFEGCSSLTSITIPDNVTSIGYSAFSYCSSLTTFYGKYTSIDNRCLVQNGNLIAFAPTDITEYTILDSVTSIGNYAFYGCSSLTNITIPDSVTSIGDGAFWKCSSLTSIYCKPITPPALGYLGFNEISSTAKIYVPTASVNAYESVYDWRSYASKIRGYDFNE